MELWKHQKIALEKFKGKDCAALFWEMGAGKTKGSIALLKDNSEEDSICLIICPKNLQRQWKDNLCEDAFIYNSQKVKTKKGKKLIETFLDSI